MAREDLHFRLRIPEGLKQDVERAAIGQQRSMTAEIVARLEESFSDPVSLPARLRRRIRRDAEEKGLSWKEQAVAALETIYPGGMTLGEFMENYVIPAAHESVDYERAYKISMANLELDAIHACLSVEEQRNETGLVTLVVFQADDDPTKARSEVARIVVTAADNTAS